jgi:MIP family channel proteins
LRFHWVFSSLFKKSIAELVGTFTLVFAGCGSVMVTERFPGSISISAIPVIFGLAVAVMIYAVGHISGAHFNPAVTLAFAAARHFPKEEVLVYWLSQITGALGAIGLLTAILPPGKSFGATIPAVPVWQALTWEIVLTFFLMFVIVAVATDTRAVGTMAGAAIGGTVMLAAWVGGPVTGASMNPARSLAPALFAGRLDVMWIYILGPTMGAILAALLYESIRMTASEPKK